jgi:transcriptional regulator with XRE-family HTH domain
VPNHPHRSRRKEASGRNPTPEQIRKRRERVHLSQLASARLIHVSLRSWEDWEAGRTRMHPNHWRAYLADTQPLIDDPEGCAGWVREQMARS